MSRLAAVAALAAVALGSVLVLGGRDEAYRVTVPLANASGLESGSAVVIGGLQVGEVDLELHGDTVLAHLDIEPDHAPLGRGAKAAVVAQNLLGKKQLRIEPGDRRRPLPDGARLQASAVSVSTDLDQVLDVLAPDTRARLAVLVNEAGAAVTGRTLDIESFVGRLPQVLERGAALADEIAAETGVLRDLVARTDRTVATVTRERASLTRLVDRAGAAAETVAARRARLRQTLGAAPRAMRELRGLLDGLRRSAPPLGRTARNLSAAAAPLRAALDEVPRFQTGASPTLEAAGDAAGQLDRLAADAAPFLRQALPVVSATEALSTQEVPPTAAIVDRSFSNTIAILENWSRAIQFRDRMSHVFRAELGVPLISLTSAIDRLANARRAGRRRARRAAPRPRRVPDRTTTAPAKPEARPPAVRDTVRSVKKALDDLTGAVAPDLPRLLREPAGGGGERDLPVLDFLLRP